MKLLSYFFYLIWMLWYLYTFNWIFYAKPISFFKYSFCKDKNYWNWLKGKLSSLIILNQKQLSLVIVVFYHSFFTFLFFIIMRIIIIITIFFFFFFGFFFFFCGRNVTFSDKILKGYFHIAANLEIYNFLILSMYDFWSFIRNYHGKKFLIKLKFQYRTFLQSWWGFNYVNNYLYYVWKWK